jgi:hypothetical protein
MRQSFSSRVLRFDELRVSIKSIKRADASKKDFLWKCRGPFDSCFEKCAAKDELVFVLELQRNYPFIFWGRITFHQYFLGVVVIYSGAQSGVCFKKVSIWSSSNTTCASPWFHFECYSLPDRTESVAFFVQFVIEHS